MATAAAVDTELLRGRVHSMLVQARHEAVRIMPGDLLFTSEQVDDCPYWTEQNGLLELREILSAATGNERIGDGRAEEFAMRWHPGNEFEFQPAQGKPFLSVYLTVKCPEAGSPYYKPHIEFNVGPATRHLDPDKSPPVEA